MKQFEMPECKVLNLQVRDVITTSNELPFEPASLDAENMLDLTSIGKP